MVTGSSKAAIALLYAAFICHNVSAFSTFRVQPVQSTVTVAYRHSAIYATNPSNVRSQLSEEDKVNIAKARLALGKSPEKTEEEEPPKLFDDELYDNMTNVLLMLEKRVKEGPGAINKDDFDHFQSITEKIKESVLNGPSDTVSARPAKVEASSFVTPVTTTSASVPAPVAPVSVTQAVENVEKPFVQDTSNDEGPSYEGKGGMGLAHGTRNTYIIPGMDEMTPEEYRAALQESVSEAQRKRKLERNNVVGNKASHQYLDELGWGGNSASWKPREDKASSESSGGYTPWRPKE